MATKPLAARIFMVALLIVPPPIAPATIVVDGDCTLVDAITAANSDTGTGGCSAGSGADVIELTTDVTLTEVNNTTVGANGLPLITSDLKITGVGESLPRAIVRDLAAPAFRIFDVDFVGILSLENVSVRHGSSIGDPIESWAGAIRNLGDLTLRYSELSDNSSDSGGGAIRNGGFGSAATATLINSTVLRNSAFRGGGIYNAGGTLLLTNSTVSDNSAGAEGGGIYSYYGTVTLTNSTVSGNSAGGDGGGIFNSYPTGTVILTNSTVSGNSASGGGGLSNTYYGQAVLTNSTVSGNYAYLGGGIHNSSDGEVTLTSMTVASNSADYGGGIYNLGSATLTGSLVANSLMGGNCDGPAPVTDSGNNLADDATCGSIPSDLTGFDPVLEDHGGPTMTHALLDNSSAIDVGSMPDCPVTDQRGAARQDTCDIGSFEWIGCPDLVLSDDTIEVAVTVEHCQTIVTGPNFAVAGTGNLTLRAGRSVESGNETSVLMGGQLAVEIDPDLQLIPP